MKTAEVDVAIVGAGTAGLAAYREVRKSTQRIALIDGGPLGTTCARVGCMPSKLLIAPAEARHRLQALPQFGIRSDAGIVDGAAVMRRIRSERDRFVNFVLESMRSFDPEHLVRACARFEDPFTLRLKHVDESANSSADLQRVRAKRIILATGSRPRIPQELEAAGDRLIVSDDVFDWQDLPDSVAVFGAGVIGLELGQALHRLGVRVHLFGREGALAGISDPAIRACAIETLGAELSMTLNLGNVKIERDANGVVVQYNDVATGVQTHRFDYLLATAGRKPNVDGLALENSGLRLSANGVPEFDPLTLRAADSHIFIAGDANADRPVLHEAADEGRLAGDNAARYPDVLKRARHAPMGIVFSDPQIAFAGRRHAQLVAERIDFCVGEASFEDQGRARVMLVNQGLLRVYAERGSGILLGAEMIGPQHEHLAHLLAWAIQLQLGVADVLELPFYHPVIEEGLRSALRDLLQALGMGPKPPPNCIDCGPGA
ncbi:MAG: dihydrolipoyl dehydrogenase [Rudaea sp.]